jgi:hypothetical protein
MFLLKISPLLGIEENEDAKDLIIKTQLKPKI